jgi:hypothetical protein
MNMYVYTYIYFEIYVLRRYIQKCICVHVCMCIYMQECICMNVFLLNYINMYLHIGKIPCASLLVRINVKKGEGPGFISAPIYSSGIDI